MKRMWTRLLGWAKCEAKASRPAPRRLGVEALEKREVPAALLSAGVLTVTGTNRADNLVVRQTAAALVVPGMGSFNAARVSRVVVRGLGGNDMLDVRTVTRPLTLDGGVGADRFFLDPANPARLALFQPAQDRVLFSQAGVRSAVARDGSVLSLTSDGRLHVGGVVRCAALGRITSFVPVADGTIWATLAGGQTARIAANFSSWTVTGQGNGTLPAFVVEPESPDTTSASGDVITDGVFRPHPSPMPAQSADIRINAALQDPTTPRGTNRAGHLVFLCGNSVMEQVPGGSERLVFAGEESYTYSTIATGATGLWINGAGHPVYTTSDGEVMECPSPGKALSVRIATGATQVGVLGGRIIIRQGSVVSGAISAAKADGTQPRFDAIARDVESFQQNGDALDVMLVDRMVWRYTASGSWTPLVGGVADYFSHGDGGVVLFTGSQLYFSDGATTSLISASSVMRVGTNIAYLQGATLYEARGGSVVATGVQQLVVAPNGDVVAAGEGYGVTRFDGKSPHLVEQSVSAVVRTNEFVFYLSGRRLSNLRTGELVSDGVRAIHAIPGGRLLVNLGTTVRTYDGSTLATQSVLDFLTVKSVEVQFHTFYENKDWDTDIRVDVRTSNDKLVAERGGIRGEFRRFQTGASYPLQVLPNFRVRDLLRSRMNIQIKPVGRDVWEFVYFVTARLSDNSVLRWASPLLELSHDNLAWGGNVGVNTANWSFTPPPSVPAANLPSTPPLSPVTPPPASTLPDAYRNGSFLRLRGYLGVDAHNGQTASLEDRGGYLVYAPDTTIRGGWNVAGIVRLQMTNPVTPTGSSYDLQLSGDYTFVAHVNPGSGTVRFQLSKAGFSMPVEAYYDLDQGTFTLNIGIDVTWIGGGVVSVAGTLGQ